MGRYYKINDKELPSVTTIIADCTDKSRPLTQWAANMTVEWIKKNCSKSDMMRYQVTEDQLNEARFNFREISQEALDIGSAVHHAIETWLETGEEPKGLSEQALTAFVAFLEWAEKFEIETIATEQKVYSDCWAGTLDLKCKLLGKQGIIDFKSSKSIYPEYRYQLAAYRSVDDDNEFHAVLRLDKETGYPEYKDFSKTYKKDLNVFNKMVALYFARHPRIAKKAGWEG